MTISDEERKKAVAIILRRHAAKSPPESLTDVLGASYVQKLEALSNDQAVEYLKTVDESELPGAYYVLSKRLPPATRAEICRGYMSRTTFRARIIGVGEIGIWLAGSRDAALSRVLAKIARDPSENPAIRWKAYVSLESVSNGESTSLDRAILDDPGFLDRPCETWLERVDWAFVDSFLGS